MNLKSNIMKISCTAMMVNLLLWSMIAAGQTLVTAPVTSTPASGEYYSNSSITLSPNFSYTATSGHSLHYYIVSPSCYPLATNPGNQNYILTTIPKNPAFNSSASGYTVCDAIQTVQYFDGLGRPLQTVQVRASAAGKDMVQPFVYDQFGREANKYLPYAATTTDGSLKTNALTDLANFYNPGGTGTSGAQQANGVVVNPYPLAQTVFEASPLNRPVENGAPGTPWQTGGGHTVTTAYGVNIANEIPLWTVTSTGATGSTFYAAGTLYTTIVNDEMQHATIEYKDMDGKVVCKKVQSGTGTYYATSYVYDDFGNLVYVIPPIPTGTTYPTSFAETDAVFTNFIYGYHYDGRNRLTEKKVPGKGWEFMVYNMLDQVVATQDTNQRVNNQWLYTKYDAQGRVVNTGTWNNGGTAITRASLQSSVNAATTLWETATGGTGNGYSNSAWPTGSTTTLTLNYYDSYSNLPGAPAAYAGPSGYNITPQGLLVGTRTAVLNTPTDLLWTVHYYDDKGRNLKTYAQHYLGGTVNDANYDAITNTYDFTNEVTAITRQHYTIAGLALTIANRYTYDQVGRKIETWQTMNDAEVLLAKLDYNEAGQLKTKQLGNGLQSTAYAYNERGWLKSQASPEFSMELKYNDAINSMLPQFNGNIANQVYTNGNSNTFNYSYDPLNRLTNGSASGMSEALSYDELGNIKTLSRDGGTTGTYNYLTGNQLNQITGGPLATAAYQYDPNGNAVYDGRNNKTIGYNLLNLPQTVTGGLSYTYDAAGQKLRKQTSSFTTDYISGIQYNNGAIEFVQTEEGIARRVGTAYSYEYNLKDHLGNTRVTFYKNPTTQAIEVIQRDDYYAFGLQKPILASTNKYLYNGKELQDELGQYDYGARFYDPVVARWNIIDPLADLSNSTSPYAYVVNNPMIFIDKFGLDTGKMNTLPEVTITAKKIAREIMDLSTYFTRPIGLPRYSFKEPDRTDIAENFNQMAYNAIITHSSKTVIKGQLLEKLKKDPAFQAWRKKILSQYKTNPQLKRYLTSIKLGGQPFFSPNGDTEVKLSVRGANLTAEFIDSNGLISINYQIDDVFDLDYQAGRGAVYNGINGVLKPIWMGVFDGRDDMKVEANWNETIKK